MENKKIKLNPMKEIEMEKLVLNCGGTDDKLEKAVKLLKMISVDRKVYQIKSTKRIPAFGISPGKKSGCKVTIRDKAKIIELLKRVFAALDNELNKKQITENHVSFGIREYIEVPGLEYDREIGILGFEASLVFKRKGKRVKMKKIKRGKYPRRQSVTKQEITDFLIKTFGIEVVEKQ
jgi:large subunit ribosomal protein L5